MNAAETQGPPYIASPLGAPVPSPPLAGRFVGAFFGFIILVGLLVVLPLYLLGRLTTYGVHAGLTPSFIEFSGVALAVLIAIRFAVKPTSLYGPAWIAVSGATIAYLLTAAPNAVASLAPGSGVNVSLGAGELFRWLVIPAGISLVAALITTAEDLLHPGERVRIDFPTRFPG